MKTTSSPEPISVTRTAVFDAPLEEVWEALTDPAAMSEWLADGVELDTRPGGVGALALPDGDRSVLVTAVEPSKRLSMLWWGDSVSSVDLTLTETDAGTELVVVERLIVPPGAADVARVTMDMRWGCAFALLSTFCSAGAAPGGDPARGVALARA